ncbi:hypothetical protein [Acetivibrio clariflavus]|uniref:Membrane trafficking protein n=1 Tax=Acetivibrio clariflavus (strain DSM 19732 / NBRC 101661 / EBR45) TaxID=720554 RepID=G8LTW5_ACECE|nr:hypothetical protein [Acetivibrio clariflavus]AEV67311.1 hypothetical protein Clocl_0601 [Acetivibrio clariflavus DSM 19732]
MSNQGNKNLMDLLNDKMLQVKLNNAIDMLKKGNTEELAKKLNKMDKNELIEKINEIDENKLKELNLKIDKDEMKKLINEVDMNSLSQLIGDRGDEIIDKLKKLLDSNQ